jgi:general secretion pathway protein E
MSGRQSLQFFEHLRRTGRLATVKTGDGSYLAQGPEGISPGSASQRRLWEIVDLPASELADEAVSFFEHERVTLQELLEVEPLAGSFSPRFLRDTLMFPYRSLDGRAALAVADPTDRAAQRVAEIVLRRDITITVASVEDLSVVLDRRLGEDNAEPADAAGQLVPREDDIESVRDLASGAPVVRAVNDLLEKAVELRASDIHIERFQTGLVVRMRVDGLLRPVGHKIDEVAIRAGITTMVADGVAKCRAGLTSPAELLRVTTVR